MIEKLSNSSETIQKNFSQNTDVHSQLGKMYCNRGDYTGKQYRQFQFISHSHLEIKPAQIFTGHSLYISVLFTLYCFIQRLNSILETKTLVYAYFNSFICPIFGCGMIHICFFACADCAINFQQSSFT